MSRQAGTNRRRKRGLIAALAALVLVALALGSAAAVWALNRPRGIQVSPSSITFGDLGFSGGPGVSLYGTGRTL